MTQTITLNDLRQRIAAGEDVQLIDVRSGGEYATGHVPSAANIPMDQAEARLGDLKPDSPVVLICQSGKRASLTCDLLRSHHPGLLVLEGGTGAWVEAGLPVVRTASTRWSLDRQVRLGAGLLTLTGTILAVMGHAAWIFLAMFVGAGLTFAGLTNICGMANVLALMPWNRPAKAAAQATAAGCETR